MAKKKKTNPPADKPVKDADPLAAHVERSNKNLQNAGFVHVRAVDLVELVELIDQKKKSLNDDQKEIVDVYRKSTKSLKTSGDYGPKKKVHLQADQYVWTVRLAVELHGWQPPAEEEEKTRGEGEGAKGD